MSTKISGSEHQLSKIFSSDFDYVIPPYQRPYAWTEDQASELFDDLYEFYKREPEDNYFLGSIVLIKEEGEPHSEVIDGQQRLTTFTILLASLASMLSGDLRADFGNYIREPGKASQRLKPKPRLSLRERDQELFAQYVQSLDFDGLLDLDSEILKNESQRNIQSNSKLILDRLRSKFSDNEKSLCNFGSFIVQQCYLVVVSTPSQQSAFRIFSVLNNRGLDLLPTDIVKADVIGNIPDDRQDEFTERWEELEVQTGRNGLNDLFGYIRMIHAKAKAKRALIEEFNEHVISKMKSSEELIENVLEPYAEAYMIAKTSQYVSTKNAEEINDLLKWLKRIDNSDWLPSAILFLSQKKGDADYVLWFFRKLERLTAYLHICAKNVNQRIERYEKVLSDLENRHSFESPVQAIELNVVEKKEMIDALDGKIYELTARRRNYLILRLDSFFSDGAATYDPSLLTIEHVLPQTITDESDWCRCWPKEEIRQKWIHRISNLVPLTQKRNSKAQNFDFQTKKKAYFGGKKGVSSYILTTQVLQTEDWTPQVVENRQKELINVLTENWELNTE